MRTEIIKADSIDAAVERILDELKEDDTAQSISSRNNVIYFDGWDGLGASAVLQAVAQRLAVASSLPAGLKFDQIIHVDFSKWESRRSLQRAIAEQLELPAQVILMDMFDRQDEEDDFHGTPEASRTEIPQVVRKMYEHIQKLNHKFLVIFHNGSDEEVDLATFCGLPLSGYSANKMLWTFQGAFRLKPRLKVDGAVNNTGTTDVFLSASGHKRDPQELWNYLVHQDAAQVARRVTTTRAAETPSAAQTVSTYYVAAYFLYMWKICGMVITSGWIMILLPMALTSVWICDGVIQLQDIIGNDCDGPWRAAAAVQHAMCLDSDYYNHHLQSLPPHLIRCADSTASMPYWTSPPHGVLFFSTGDILQHFSKLGVLKLSRCTFSFSSPLFLCCHSLRFLWLDHCQDNKAITKDETADKEEGIQHCFRALWVLDVRYTPCDEILSARMMDLMTQLREPKIRKLRVTKSTVSCRDDVDDLFSSMNKLELLDFSGNHTMQAGGEVAKFSEISTSNNCLETVMVIDGCVGIQKFSFSGCAKLRNMLLGGLFDDLRILDLLGTAVKTLDLSAMTARSLDELILDNCDKLCAILWPQGDKRKDYLQKLHINITQQSESTDRSGEEKVENNVRTATKGSSSSSSSMVLHGARAPSEFAWYISVKDTRLLRSIVPTFQNYFEDHAVQMEISSPSCCPSVDVGGSENDEGIKNSTAKHLRVLSNRQQGSALLMYADVAAVIVEGHLLQGGEGKGDNDAPTITRTWPCLPAWKLDSSDCYLYSVHTRPTDEDKRSDGQWCYYYYYYATKYYM